MLTTSDEKKKFRILFWGVVAIIGLTVAFSWWGNRPRTCYADMTTHEAFLFADDIKDKAATGSIHLTLKCDEDQAQLFLTPRYNRQ